MLSQIVTKWLLVGGLVLGFHWAHADTLESVDTVDIIAQLKAMYEVEGNTPERCEHLVTKRRHYQKVLQMLEAKKQSLRESTRSLASMGFFTAFSGAAGEVETDQLKELETAEEKYGCRAYRQNLNLIPSHGKGFEQ